MSKFAKNKNRSRSLLPQKTGGPLTYLQQKKSMTLEDGVDLWALQDKIKRMPDLYRQEFEKHFDITKTKLAEFKENPARHNEALSAYLKFCSHVSQPLYSKLLSL